MRTVWYYDESPPIRSKAILLKSPLKRSINNMSKYSIFETLEILGLASKKTIEVYSENTRDIPGLRSFRDRVSGVIFIDEYYVGDEVYQKGKYREDVIGVNAGPEYEAIMDAERRSSSYKQFYVGKTIADFGCGAGDFLRIVANDCQSSFGIELQQDYVEGLRSAGIPCMESVADFGDSFFDAIFAFHVIEHLPEPIEVIKSLHSKLTSGGVLIVEVPHANDILLGVLCSQRFRDFTLWSQHLVLHSRNSLKVLLEFCGFKDIVIEGRQRYPLSNHLNWLSDGKPGGHKSKLSMLDDPNLTRSYAAALNRVDGTDTLVAFARKI